MPISLTDMKEYHPFGVYLPPHANSMIIGSFPIGKFSHPDRSKEIKPHEFKFYFGGETNLLWKLLAGTFNRNLSTVDDIKSLLISKHLGIGDLIKSCRRKKGGGSDASLYDIEWNNELYGLIETNQIIKIYFTSKFVQIYYHRPFPDSKVKEVLLFSPSA